MSKLWLALQRSQCAGDVFGLRPFAIKVLDGAPAPSAGESAGACYGSSRSPRTPACSLYKQTQYFGTVPKGRLCPAASNDSVIAFFACPQAMERKRPSCLAWAQRPPSTL